MAAISPEWRNTGELPHSTTLVRIIVALQQENLHEVERLFWERSDPKHELYAQYLTHSDLSNLLSPGAVHEHAVREWLDNSGVESLVIEGVLTHDVLYLTATVRDIEKLFNVQLEFFEHVEVSEKRIIRTTKDYSLPVSVQSSIQLIHGINDFPPLMRKNRERNLLEPVKLDVSSPTVTILGVNGRSQTAGVNIVATVAYECPSSTPNCIGYVSVMASSSNPNILYSQAVTVPVSNCPDQICTITVPVEFYIPIGTTANGMDSNMNSVAVDQWDYPVVVNPHVVPQTLWDLYSMTGNPLVTNKNATQAVVEFEQQYYSPSDLDEFFTLMGIPSAPVTVVGPNDYNNPGGEANLDIQWIMGMAPGAPTFFWSIPANSTAEIDHILTWAYEVGNYTNPPLVNSLSYGMTEGNVDKYLGEGYLNRTNTQLQVLALMGLTIIIADGDVGANDIGPPPMSQLSCYPSHPDWPSDSAYVTAIGSTYITPLAEQICYVSGGSDCLGNPLGEVTVSVDMGMSWTTGGGFSNVTPRPSYQDFAVNQYLSNSSQTVPTSDYFNVGGRAYADAVTVGHNLECVLDGSIVAIDGTSASAPIFGGMITVLNDARLNAGKSPLGFVTPLMYQTYQDAPSCWNDITVGHNRCGAYGWRPVCCDQGFSTTVGWDPVAGVGSPNIEELKRYVLSLP